MYTLEDDVLVCANILVWVDVTICMSMYVLLQ